MKGSVVAFDTIGSRKAAARMVDGRLDDLLVDPAPDVIRPGTIYRARAGRPMKGQGGIMLETPDGSLYLRNAKGVRPGDTLLVQTGSYTEVGKAAPANPRILFKSRYCIATPGKRGFNISKAIRDEERRVELHELLDNIAAQDDLGLILRTSCLDIDDSTVLEDITATLNLAKAVITDQGTGQPERLVDGPDATEIAWRDWSAPDLTDQEPGSFARHGIDDAIEQLRTPKDALASGGSIFVEPTRALTAVDVNSGGDTSPAAALKTNIEALRALPRALRLRGIGGQIVVDPAPSSKRDRLKLESIAKSAFRTDPIETTFVGWTSLGHMEFIRKRERTPLRELL